MYLAQNWGKALPTSPVSKFLSLIHINFIFKKKPLIRCSVRLYLQLFVGRIISYLLYLCLFSHSGVQHMSWIVVLLCFSSSCVLCIQYCQFLLFGHLNVLHLYSLTSIVYLYFVFCLFTISYTYIVSHRMILRRVGCLTSRDQYFSCIMTRTSHILSISFISFILNKPSLFDKVERNTYVQYIQYTIACYTKYISNEEMYRDEQFSRLNCIFWCLSMMIWNML